MDEAGEIVPLGRGDERIGDGLGLLLAKSGSHQNVHLHAHAFHRVERAGELLRAGSGIAEAAAQAGFSGQSHLHHHVRRLLGVTPGDLARRRPPGGAIPR